MKISKDRDHLIHFCDTESCFKIPCTTKCSSQLQSPHIYESVTDKYGSDGKPLKIQFKQ